MVILFFIIGFIGAYFAWKNISKNYIDKGYSKLISYIAGVIAGLLIWFLMLTIGVALFEPKSMQNNQSVIKHVNTEKAVSTTNELYITSHNLTDAMIMSESSDILSATVNQQYAGSTFEAGMKYNVDVNIKSSVLWGGAQDWNGVAIRIFDLSKTLFKRSDIGKISFVVWNYDHTLDWARIEVDRTQLPNKWDELTYLEFFSHTKPMSGSVDAEEWLTEFYAKYNSAHPSNN
ncbi:hypothetical protein [Sulfuricurvum sp.]|uniref:hypothetical protein n=1 Tax=Sulfuricurvum sp. TaxID=2025608 RepID=UPI00262D0950|nr:hypothetical protein [Sulfuricurvum sp.]MDD2267048.1 hypothetical protein [Sulfuricurvum sp.]MDD2784947.1 hypothetical protein [Sulfuricurvum sp.]